MKLPSTVDIELLIKKNRVPLLVENERADVQVRLTTQNEEGGEKQNGSLKVAIAAFQCALYGHWRNELEKKKEGTSAAAATFFIVTHTHTRAERERGTYDGEEWDSCI